MSTPKNLAAFVDAVRTLNPRFLITLTLPAHLAPPRNSPARYHPTVLKSFLGAYRSIVGHVTSIVLVSRPEHPVFHYHLFVNAEFAPRDSLRRVWNSLTHSSLLHVRVLEDNLSLNACLARYMYPHHEVL